jgi:hypothetical protein
MGADLELEKRLASGGKRPHDHEDPSTQHVDEVPRAVGKSTLVDTLYGAAPHAVPNSEIAVGKRTLAGDEYVAHGLENLSRYDSFRVRGLREMLDVVAVRGGTQLARSTASSAESGIASRAGVWNGRPADRAGRALARAAERHAVTLYRHAADSGEVDRDDPRVDDALARAGSGQALPEELRRKLEDDLGYALHRVRIHTDGVAADAARAIRAQAFTVGEDIFFAQGAFAPGTREGQKLIVHELTHVVQAWEGRTRRGSTGIEISDPGESLELEAEATAERLDRRAEPRRAPVPTGAEIPQAPRAPRSETRPAVVPTSIPRMLVPLAHTAIAPRALIAPTAPSSAPGLILRRPAEPQKSSKPAKDPKATPAPPLLPDGVNYRLDGTAGVIIVRTAWFMEGAVEEDAPPAAAAAVRANPAADKPPKRITNPAKSRELSRELKKLFWWMTDAQVEASGDHYIEAPMATPFSKLALVTSTFQTFGLPPGTDIVWKRESADEISLILSIRQAGIEQPPVKSTSEFLISDELRKRIDDQFEKTFAIRPQSTMLPEAKLKVTPERWAWVKSYDKDKIQRLVGPAWASAKNVATADPASEETSAFGGITFPNYIPIADREYYIQWMEAALGKQAPGAGAGNVEIDDALILVMKQLDEDRLLKEQVVERMRRAKGAGGFVLDAVALRRLMHETTEEQEQIRLGLKPVPVTPDLATQPVAQPYTSPGQVQKESKTRFYERAITGKIVNLGSLASVNKSMDMLFESEDPQGLGFVGVTILWYASPLGDPTNHVRTGRTFHYAHHKPEKWSVSFDKVGKYEITARVDHQSYWPTTFKTTVDVQTEAARLDQVEQKAFGTFDDKTKITEGAHFFNVSLTNDRFGPNKYTFGTVKEGELPDGFTPRDLDSHLGFMTSDLEALIDLITVYKPRTDRASKDVVAYAEAARDRLIEARDRIRDDGKDLVPFEVRGAFLSEKNGVRSGDMKLVGLAGSRHKKKTLPKSDPKEKTVTLEWDQPTVRLHDLSQLYEPKSAVYTGEGDTFRASAELAFIDLCKAYPPGRVSIVMEQVTETGQRTGKTLGFELHTGTAWKDAKEVIWDSKVQLVVNLAAAAAAIFVPGAGAVIAMGLVTAYNAVDTIDNLAQLERKGQATRFDYAAGFVSIGLDIVPFAGELKSVGRLGKTTLFALDVAQVATNVIVVTEQGVAQVRALRDQQVTKIAMIQREVEDLRKQNDSSVELRGKERELAEEIKAAQSIATEVFLEMGKSGAVMLMAPLAFNHMLKGFAKTGAGADLAKSDLFVEGHKGETPHYDPITGKIRGDSSLLTPELSSKLSEAWTMDVYAQHADAANVLGVTPHQVVIKRDPKATKTTIKQNAEGIWEVTAPEKRPVASVLDDIWGERKKLPDAPLDRPAALERGSYEPTFSIDAIIKVGKPIVVGNRIESRTDADAILKKLAAGDPKALTSIGLEKLPKGFDPRSVEWGLGVMPDGKYVIVRGDHGSVDWGPFPEVRALAHTHPFRANKALKADGGSVGIHVLDMVKRRGNNEHNAVNFFPSAADIAFCVRNALPTHRVDTPYVHIGDGKIGNPVGDFAGKPRVSIEIQGAHHVGEFEGRGAPAYQAHVIVRDGKGTVLWEGEMVGVHNPNIGSLISFGPAPAHWRKPGGNQLPMGGDTGAGLRKPRNASETAAFADWKKLEQSGKNYGGKFDGEQWYARYEEGLRYDIASERWIRPDGRKAADPQKFDTRKWTKSKVYEHLAGPKSESTFKPFAEMLIREKIATRAQIEAMIQKKGFLGRDEDMVRHELKVEYREAIIEKMMAPKTPEAKHAAMRRMTENLDSADKGNITEAWYKEAILGGRGEAHVAARKDVLGEDQGITLDKDRFVDIIDGSIGHEIKSGEGKLSDSEVSQMQDYGRMVQGRAKLRTEAGDVVLKHVRLTFTSPQGAKANATTMRKSFNDAIRGDRISFELFTPEGKNVVVKDLAALEAQKWLFE